MGAESTAAIQRGLDLAHWTVTDLWVASVGLGGVLSRAEVQSIADGSTHATAAQHDVLAAALNDHLDDLGHASSVRYWSALPAET